MLIAGADVEENFMQYIGRIFRRETHIPVYIDLRDNFASLINHSRTRLAVCKQIGAQVFEFYKQFPMFSSMTHHIT